MSIFFFFLSSIPESRDNNEAILPGDKVIMAAVIKTMYTVVCRLLLSSLRMRTDQEKGTKQD